MAGGPGFLHTKDWREDFVGWFADGGCVKGRVKEVGQKRN